LNNSNFHIKPDGKNEFHFCPNCNSKNIKTITDIGTTHWICPDCDYDLYNNNAAAVGLFLIVENKLLVFSRVKEPQKSKLGIPGGFVNKGESLEEACIRECSEEIGIIPKEINYLCSFPNVYPYKTLVYSTCDAFFFTEYRGNSEEFLSSIKTLDGEAENCKLISLENLNSDDFAFESMRKAVAVLKKRLQK
jgi:ADP-ribose pyrophosphatase YjhB (NUDIX family)